MLAESRFPSSRRGPPHFAEPPSNVRDRGFRARYPAFEHRSRFAAGGLRLRQTLPMLTRIRPEGVGGRLPTPGLREYDGPARKDDVVPEGPETNGHERVRRDTEGGYGIDMNARTMNGAAAGAPGRVAAESRRRAKDSRPPVPPAAPPRHPARPGRAQTNTSCPVRSASSVQARNTSACPPEAAPVARFTETPTPASEPE